MILERLKNSKNLEQEIATLTIEEKQELFHEVKQQEDIFKNQKIQLEATRKATEDQIKELTEQLKRDFNINSVEDAITELDKLQSEINTGISAFVTELNKNAQV